MNTIKDRVSVIIPSYQGARLLENNLPYLVRAVEFTKKPHQIIVVNDGPDKDTQFFLKKNFPQVEVITLPKNFGFGPACNLAAKVSLYPLILFLNNDVKVSREFLSPLIDLHQQNDVFAVTPKIIAPRTGVNESVYCLYFRSGYFMTKLAEKEKVDLIDNFFPVPFGCGACLLVDRKKFFALGGFSSIFHPFYWEDVDLGYRAWKRGWQTLYQPKSLVFHQRGSTIGDSFKVSEVDKIFLRNMILFTWKNSHAHSILLRHIFTMPFDLLFAYIGRRKNFIEAFKRAMKFFKESQNLRRKEMKEILFSDSDLLSFFNSNFKQLERPAGKKSFFSFMPPEEAKGDYKKILVVHNHGGMGDIILSIPVVLTLKKNFPEAHLAFMLDKKHFDVVSGIPEINEIIPYDSGINKLSYFKEILKKIKDNKFDLGIVLWSNAKDAWLTYLAGIKVRVGQKDRLLYSFLYNKPVEVRSTRQDCLSHWSDILLDYVRILNLDKLDKRLSFYVPPEDHRHVSSLLLASHIKEKDLLIGMHISKGIAVKAENWPVDKFSRIADLLVEKFNAKVIFTGSWHEKELIEKAQSIMSHPSLNLAGKLSLKQFGALMKCLDLFICPDSGPVHLASALKVPCVAIFALKSDFPMRWHPLGTRYEMVRSFPYNCGRECVKERCPKFICLEQIDEVEVVQAAQKLLKEAPCG